jgi:hypothetical protein
MLFNSIFYYVCKSNNDVRSIMKYRKYYTDPIMEALLTIRPNDGIFYFINILTSCIELKNKNMVYEKST